MMFHAFLLLWTVAHYGTVALVLHSVGGEGRCRGGCVAGSPPLTRMRMNAGPSESSSSTATREERLPQRIITSKNDDNAGLLQDNVVVLPQSVVDDLRRRETLAGTAAILSVPLLKEFWLLQRSSVRGRR